MDKNPPKDDFEFMRLSKWAYLFVGVVLFTGLALSLVSFLQLCSVECRAEEDWKVFGVPMAPLGIGFFGALLLLHLFKFHILVGYGLALGLGAEGVLIGVQKFEIGHFCPICLGIAATVIVASFIYGIEFFKKGTNVKKISTFGCFLMGFLILFFGIAKENKMNALETNIKDQIAFGDLESPTSIYLFTDWACPACRALEPKMAQILTPLISKARFTFVDIAVHPETLNYSPYNLSFMIHNKSQYLKLRDGLTQLSIDKNEPTDEDIKQIALANGVKFEELPYAKVAMGIKYWNELQKQFDIDGTPIVVIVNATTKKGKKLAGLEEITESNILKAVESLR